MFISHVFSLYTTDFRRFFSAISSNIYHQDVVRANTIVNTVVQNMCKMERSLVPEAEMKGNIIKYYIDLGNMKLTV
jgi:hypothetical protein